MDLFLDISPNYISSSYNEPCEVENQIVLQIRNSSAGSITLYNKSGRTDYPFKPIEEAEDIEGLTMIYFVFKLGSDSGCLTSAEYFRKAGIICQDGYKVTRVGDDTLVLFPTANQEIPVNGQTELVISGLITQLESGQPSTCRVKFFNADGGDWENTLPIYKNRNELLIKKFELAAGYEIVAFRDYVRFNWMVLGAESCIFTPGDVSLAEEGRGIFADQYTAMLNKRTMFTLVASRDNRKVSKSCEVIPVIAEIVSFTATSQQAPSGGYTATLKFVVKNTRHAFLNRVGRIEVESNVEKTVTLAQKEKAVSYTLAVENESGLTTRTCTTA